MTCPEFEPCLLDYLENRLPEDARARIAAHLAGCTECQALSQQFQQLDTALARAITTRGLSPEFTARLQRRLAAEPARLPEAQRAARRRVMELEDAMRLAQLRQNAFNPAKGLEATACLAAAGLLAWWLVGLAPSLGGMGIELPFGSFGQGLLLSSLAGLVLLVGGLGIAARCIEVAPAVFFKRFFCR